MSTKKDKEIEIIVDGKALTMELLWKDAPKTCEAILEALPLDSTKTVEGRMVYGCAGQNAMMLRWLKTAAPFTVPPENNIVYLRNGYCYWKTYEEPARDMRSETSLNEFFICWGGLGGGGGYGYSWGPQGPDPLNEFARIKNTREEVNAALMQMRRGSEGKTIMRRKK